MAAGFELHDDEHMEGDHIRTQIGKPGIVVVVIAGLLLQQGGGAIAAEEANPEPSAQDLVALQWGAPCDAKNHSLLVENKHTFKSVTVSLRWHAEGGRDQTAEFVLTPNVIKEIGCAAEATIVRVELHDF